VRCSEFWQSPRAPLAREKHDIYTGLCTLRSLVATQSIMWISLQLWKTTLLLQELHPTSAERQHSQICRLQSHECLRLRGNLATVQGYGRKERLTFNRAEKLSTVVALNQKKGLEHQTYSVMRAWFQKSMKTSSCLLLHLSAANKIYSSYQCLFFSLFSTSKKFLNLSILLKLQVQYILPWSGEFY